MTYDLIISVVLYRNPKEEINTLLRSFHGSKLNYRLILIDNDPGAIDFNFQELPPRVDYLASQENLGYGKGHNLVINNSNYQSKYHLIANADIEFSAPILESIFQHLEASPGVALLMPKIIYPSGEDQGLRKLLPSPADLFLRRFLPGALKGLFKKMEDRYQLRSFQPAKAMLVPVLSGCFMFCRKSALQACKGFDPRYFLYMEDVDLSRRLNEQGDNLYWPEVSVIHHYQKDSYSSGRNLKLHLRSAIQYFNKYGWIWDQHRREVNRKALNQKQT